MTISSVSQGGLQGVQNGLRQLNQSANEIVRNGTTDQEPDAGNLAQSIVDLKQAENQVKASARVIRAEDEAIGSLLDDFA